MFVIRYIIPVVITGRLIYRRQPDYIDSQFLKIIQMSRDSVQIPDTIPVAVSKAARINLVYYAFLPPLIHLFHPILFKNIYDWL